jgi:multidrug efflux pump subunit AcrB
LEGCIRQRRIFLPAFLGAGTAAFLLIPWLGQDFFPATDAGQFILHFRAKTATRIEETARLGDLIETSMAQAIPPRDL